MPDYLRIQRIRLGAEHLPPEVVPVIHLHRGIDGVASAVHSQQQLAGMSHVVTIGSGPVPVCNHRDAIASGDATYQR